MHLWLCHRPRQATPHLGNILLKLNVDTKLPLIPSNSRSGIHSWKPSICQGSIIPYASALQETLLINSLDCRKSCTSCHPSITLWIPDSLCTVHLVFHVSMLEPATLNLTWLCWTPTSANHCQWWTRNSKISRSSTPRLTIHPCCKLLYHGCWTVTRALMKKLHGSSLLNLDMLQTHCRLPLSIPGKSGPLQVWSSNFVFLVFIIDSDGRGGGFSTIRITDSGCWFQTWKHGKPGVQCKDCLESIGWWNGWQEVQGFPTSKKIYQKFLGGLRHRNNWAWHIPLASNCGIRARSY